MPFDLDEMMKDDSERAIVLSGKQDFVNLQMALVTTSMNHEYIRKEYDQSRSYTRKEALLCRMMDLKNVYFDIRQKLESIEPEKVISLEDELRLQKMTVLTEHTLQ